MSGEITTAVRFNDGTLEFHSNIDMGAAVFSYMSFFDGDDGPAKAFMAEAADGLFDAASSIREDEHGILVIDFVTRRILFNREDQVLDRTTFLDPRIEWQQEMARAGRVTITCPKGSFDPVAITGDMVSSFDHWMRLVKGKVLPSHKPEDLVSATPPKWYFYRLDPRPEFVFDLAPWTFEAFKDTSEFEDDRVRFWEALEAIGFPVDRDGWMSGFDDHLGEDDEDDDD